MASNTPTDEELQHYANILRQSGKYTLTSTVLGTPPPPTLTRETLNTPEREYYSEQSTGRPSLFSQTSRKVSFSDTSSARPSLPAVHQVHQDDIPPPIPPRPPLPRGWIDSLPRTSSLGESFTLGASATSRIPKLPQFSGDSQKGDSEFDVWRYDLNCLIHSGVYPQHVLLEAIRTSLKGRARTVLLHLGELASVADIMAELEALYGNISSTEKLKEQFYLAHQKVNENVADYSLRLEQLLRHSSLHFDQETKNEMLRNRLWSGLRDKELRNAARYKFETVRSFNLLRKELRQIEQELTPEKTPDKGSSQEVASNMTLVESRLMKQLESLSCQMKTMNNKMEAMDKEMREMRKGSSEGSESRKQALNRQRPPPKGQ